MAENDWPAVTSPSKLAKSPRLPRDSSRTPMASNRLYNLASVEDPTGSNQLISPPPEETLHFRRTSGARSTPFTPSLLASSSKRKRHVRQTSIEYFQPTETTPNPKPRKQSKHLTAHLQPESPTRSSFRSSTPTTPKSTFKYVKSPHASNPDADFIPPMPKSPSRRDSMSARARRTTPIPAYEPPSDVFTPPRVVTLNPTLSKSSKRKSTTKSKARRVTPEELRVVIKKELPPIDLSAPMPPSSPTDDPLLLTSTPIRAPPPPLLCEVAVATSSPIQASPMQEPNVLPPSSSPMDDDLPDGHRFDWGHTTSTSSEFATSMDVDGLPLFDFNLPGTSDVGDTGWSDSEDEAHVDAMNGEVGEGEYTGRFRTVSVRTKQDPPSSATKERMDQWGRPITPFPWKKIERLNLLQEVSEEAERDEESEIGMEEGEEGDTHEMEGQAPQEGSQCGDEEEEREVREMSVHSEDAEEGEELRASQEAEGSYEVEQQPVYHETPSGAFAFDASIDTESAQQEPQAGYWHDISPESTQRQAPIGAFAFDASIDSASTQEELQASYDDDNSLESGQQRSTYEEETPSGALAFDASIDSTSNQEEPQEISANDISLESEQPIYQETSSDAHAFDASTDSAYTQEDADAHTIQNETTDAMLTDDNEESFSYEDDAAVDEEEQEVREMSVVEDDEDVMERHNVTPSILTDDHNNINGSLSYEDDAEEEREVREMSVVEDDEDALEQPIATSSLLTERPITSMSQQMESNMESVPFPSTQVDEDEVDYDRVEVVDMPDDGDDDSDTSDDVDFGVVKISSADPRAAARAAAILKQHDYDCFTKIMLKQRKRHSLGGTHGVSSGGITKSTIMKDKHRRRTTLGGSVVIGDDVYMPGSAATTLPELLKEAEEAVVSSTPISQPIEPATPQLDLSRNLFKTPVRRSSVSETAVPPKIVLGERQWAKDDWKLLDACFTDERLALGGVEGMAPADRVHPHDVVVRFLDILGGLQVVETFGLGWDSESLIQRVKALQNKQRSGNVAPPTTPYTPSPNNVFTSSRHIASMEVPDFTPLGPRARPPARASKPVLPPPVAENAPFSNIPPGKDKESVRLRTKLPMSLLAPRYSHLLEEAVAVSQLSTEIADESVVDPDDAQDNAVIVNEDAVEDEEVGDEDGDEPSLFMPLEASMDVLTPSQPHSPSPPPPGPATIGKRVKGFLFSYLPTLSKTAPPGSRKTSHQLPRQPGLPLPPLDILDKPRGPIATPVRPAPPKAPHPKELVHLNPAPPPPTKSTKIPRAKAKRLVDLNHVSPPLQKEKEIIVPRPRRSSGGSVKDLVKSFEEMDSEKKGGSQDKALEVRRVRSIGDWRKTAGPQAGSSGNGKKPGWRP